jgi:hypothetical protein
MIRKGLFIALLLVVSCDYGLEPPPPRPPFGAIRGFIEYRGAWPPADSLRDFRFVAMRIIPDEVSDFINLNNIEFTPERLPINVAADTFLLAEVPNGFYLYNGIAQMYGPNVFADWRPVGLYTENGGTIDVRGDTVEINILVDFNNLPPFPPQ